MEISFEEIFSCSALQSFIKALYTVTVPMILDVSVWHTVWAFRWYNKTLAAIVEVYNSWAAWLYDQSK